MQSLKSSKRLSQAGQRPGVVVIAQRQQRKLSHDQATLSTSYAPITAATISLRAPRRQRVRRRITAIPPASARYRQHMRHLHLSSRIYRYFRDHPAIPAPLMP